LLLFLSALCSSLPPDASAQTASPFSASASFELRGTAPVVRVVVEGPAGYILYADRLDIRAGVVDLIPLNVPAPQVEYDKFTEEKTKIYMSRFEGLYGAPADVRKLSLTVSFQGCSDKLCFFPETRKFDLTLQQPPDQSRAAAVTRTPAATAADWRAAADSFSISAREAGYLGRDQFLAFLDRASGSHSAAATAPAALKLGLLATVLGILAGGIGLNLTPCVLPLIPINLAIIGAGARAGSKRRGFALGGAYGLGMAVVYGLLGLVAVLTGAKFGSLNSSPWFNLVIAVVFFVLALAMFDVIQIDFTRFQGRGGTTASGGGRLVAAFAMGAVAALLAGACVAPVVISVLLLAGRLYTQGKVIGLFLPFLLGVGMALPWPFAGAGLSFLPKPGKWMEWVKYAFGVLIAAFAVYYGREAYSLFRGGQSTGAGALAAQLDAAYRKNEPVFIDFWASWCKNCLVMDKTTFKDPEVQQRLARFAVIKYQAEQPNESPAKDVLDYFGAVGLPTYVVLVPRPSAGQR
jgi:thioredoxin:protein disulfide reductase